MKKTSTLLTLGGLIGVISIFLYTKINISLIIPLIPMLIIFKGLFLLGILGFLSILSTDNKLKKVSFIFFFLGILLSILSSMGYFPIKPIISIEILLVLVSYILMISLIFEGLIRKLILSAILFPALSLIGVSSQIIGVLSITYITLIAIFSVFNFQRN